MPRVTIAGGVAKMTKLAQGRLDLHSKRGEADLSALAACAGRGAGGCRRRIAGANTVAEAFAHAAAAGLALGDAVAAAAWRTAAEALRPAPIELEIVAVRPHRRPGRAGQFRARFMPPPRPGTGAGSPGS